ncbi:phytoene desaturase family protein [Candidatus Kapabacteria bacterium]|nr:phytoene desaturase family protein [Candidatus Kapabacteria bacterium]
MNKKVIIIGSGIGGLSASIYLANAGFKVQVFEKNEKAGGKVNSLQLGDYSFDMGPSLITMPFVFENLFKSVGEDIGDYLQFQKLDTICKYFWEDGISISASSKIEKMQSEIKKISESDIFSYPEFLEYSKKIYDFSKELFLFEPFQESDVILKVSNLKKLFEIRKLDAFRTVNEAVESYFDSDKVQQIFNRYATYNGSNPFVAPATLNIIPWVEYGIGGYYIKGGIYKLAEALEQLAKKLGVQFQYNTKVEKILTDNKRAIGIKAGLEYYSDYVLANSDVVETSRTLTDELPNKKLEKLESSLSGMVFLWGIKDKFDRLEHHNIIFTENYKNEFNQLFNTLEAPDDPTVYISITSKKDRSHAPNNCENWFVLLNMPYDNGQDWESLKQVMKSKIIRKLKKIGIDINGKIEEETILSPKDLHSMYLSNKGSIYGISSNNKYSAFLRPQNRSKDIKNLYFAGGSSHPGGGVPLVALSGKIAAELIIKKESLKLNR